MLFICAATIMINLTDIPWNSYDYATRNRSIKYCKKDKMCLKKFVKKDHKGIHYYAICGERTSK